MEGGGGEESMTRVIYIHEEHNDVIALLSNQRAGLRLHYE